MIAVYFIFLILSFFLSLKKPTLFVILFITISTKFFGFINPGHILLSGSEVGYFLFNIMTFTSAIITLSKISLSKKELIILTVLSSFYLYGLFLPLIFQYSTLFQALVASKSMMFYSLLFYLIAYKNKISIPMIFTFMKYLGVYLTLIEVIYVLTNLSPPSYLEAKYKVFIYQRVYYSTYISFSLFLFVLDWLNNKASSLRTIVTILFLLYGIFLSEYMSVLFSSIVILLIIGLLYSKKLSININNTILKSTFFVIIISLFFAFNDNLRKDVEATIMQNISGKSIELSSRAYYNQFRWDAINDEPLFGFGFIHKNAAILNHYKNDKTNKFMETFVVIDSGYVDILVRFGYLGLSVLIISMFILIYTNYIKREKEDYISVLFFLSLIQYFTVNYTWAVFTYPQGIIPLSLMVYSLVYSNQISKEIKENSNLWRIKIIWK